MHLCVGPSHASHDLSFLDDVGQKCTHESVLRWSTAWRWVVADSPATSRGARSPFGARLWRSSPQDCVQHPYTYWSNSRDLPSLRGRQCFSLLQRFRTPGEQAIFPQRSEGARVAVDVPGTNLGFD